MESQQGLFLATGQLVPCRLAFWTRRIEGGGTLVVALLLAVDVAVLVIGRLIVAAEELCASRRTHLLDAVGHSSFAVAAIVVTIPLALHTAHQLPRHLTRIDRRCTRVPALKELVLMILRTPCQEVLCDDRGAGDESGGLANR